MKDGEGKLTLLVSSCFLSCQEACKASSLIEANLCGAMAGMAVAFCQLVRHDKACPSETLKVILFFSGLVAKTCILLYFFMYIFLILQFGDLWRPWKTTAELGCRVCLDF